MIYGNKVIDIHEELEDGGIELVDVYDENGVLLESKKVLGYGGTKKVEKKYNIPDDICIERKDIIGCNMNTDVVEKAKKAVRYIKDPEDINKYFKSLMKSVFYTLVILKEQQIKMYTASKGLYELYQRSYKGDNPIDIKKILRSVAIKFGATMVASAGIGAATGTVIGKSIAGAKK